MNKDTDTVFLYKFGVMGRGGIRYPTKVEVSFRDLHPADGHSVEPVAPDFVEAYLEPGAALAVARYDRRAAVRQKLGALVGRTHVQARDVFDLHMLGFDAPDVPLVGHVVERVEPDDLEVARDRVLEISFEEFDGQVIEFLSEEARVRFGSRTAWDGIRLAVAGAIEAALLRARERA